VTAAPVRSALAGAALLLVACTQATQSAAPVPSAPATVASEAPASDYPPAPTQPAPARPARPDLGRVRVRLERVADLAEPIALAVRRGDATLYVAERGGRVRALRGGRVDDTVLDISDRTRAGGEQGLLGIDFTADGSQLLVSYTDRDGHSHLDAYRMTGRTADPASRRELLFVEQPYANHNGGNVVTGPDGLAYLGLGDGGSAGDPEGRAQNPDTLLGKMVRLDPLDAQPEPEIYLSGLRNPWRFSFDRDTGALWVGDVGQNSVEEITVVDAGEPAGGNLGWDLFEGTQTYEGDGTEPEQYVGPVYEYATSEGCAVTGGYVYRGSQIPQLRGAYLFADVCNGRIQALDVRRGEVRRQAEVAEAPQPASFGEDDAGELYVLSLAGGLFKIVAE
jgi:glucose/arabinose dehydrogenase